MEDFLLYGGTSLASRNPFMRSPVSSLFSGIGSVSASRVTGTEMNLLSDSSFSYDRKKRGLLSRALGGTVNAFSLGLSDMATGSRRNDLQVVSRGVNLRGVSQDDYQDLLGLDLFRGGQASQVGDTEISEATYKQNRQTGEIGRTRGEALSLLDEEGLERLSQVVSSRQGQILNRSLTPGLGTQSFSLFSGNFS